MHPFVRRLKSAEIISTEGLQAQHRLRKNLDVVGYGTTSDNLTAAFVAVPGGRGDRGQAAGVPQPQGQWQAGPPQPRSRDLDQEQHFPESNEEDYDVFYTRLSPEEGNRVEAKAESARVLSLKGEFFQRNLATSEI